MFVYNRSRGTRTGQAESRSIRACAALTLSEDTPQRTHIHTHTHTLESVCSFFCFFFLFPSSILPFIRSITQLPLFIYLFFLFSPTALYSHRLSLTPVFFHRLCFLFLSTLCSLAVIVLFFRICHFPHLPLISPLLCLWHFLSPSTCFSLSPFPCLPFKI